MKPKSIHSGRQGRTLRWKSAITFSNNAGGVCEPSWGIA